MTRRSRQNLVALLLTAQAFLLAVGAVKHFPVLDEAAHLASGIANWELARFDLYKVNPPLARMLAALPAIAAGAETDYGSYSLGVGVRAEFAMMDDFARANGERVVWLVTLARCGLMPLILLGGYACYRWARELYGDAAGIAALALLVVLGPAAAVLVLVSSQTGFSRYIRYVLPISPFLFVWISSLFRGAFVRNATSGARRGIRRFAAVAPAAFLAWSVISSLWFAPRWMSYFNELAGGPMGGPAHLVDAQVDWGQDLLYLKKWLDSHPDARPLGLAYFGSINPAVAGVDFVLPPFGVIHANEDSAPRDSKRPAPIPSGGAPAQIVGVPSGLKPGWYAVSVNFLYGYPQRLYGPGGEIMSANRPYYSYFRRFRPVATAGFSIYIYHLTVEEIAVAGEPEATGR